MPKPDLDFGRHAPSGSPVSVTARMTNHPTITSKETTMDFRRSPALGGALSQLLPAIGTNLVISIIAMILALIGGTALTILRTLRHSPLNAVIGVVISFIRGTPILVQIFLFYYGLPALGLDLSPIQAGILAIAFNSSIFITEIMRGGLSGMDSGPVEAAIALGIKGKVIWTKVILPQLYIRIMPPLVNESHHNRQGHGASLRHHRG